MNVRPVLCAGWAALWLSVLAGPALAENARLPYHLLYNAEKARQELNRAHTNLLMVLTLQATLPGVESSNLAACIEAKAGKIPIQIGTAGNFSIPLRADLLAEDPWIVINQPKGTMELSVQFGVILGPITNAVRYARLMKPVRESEEVEDELRPYFPGSPRLTRIGLRFTFPAAREKALAVIHARAGDRRLEADSQGQIVVPLVGDLLEEDPVITFSDTPGTVEILSRQSGP